MFALKYHLEVRKNGKLNIPPVPLKNGMKVEIIILPESESEFTDLMQASESSLNFWNNPIDDRIWNNV